MVCSIFLFEFKYYDKQLSQFDSSGLEAAVNSISGGFVRGLCTVWANVWPVHPTSMEGEH